MALGALMFVGILESQSALAELSPEEELLKASIDIDNVVAQTTALLAPWTRTPITQR